MVQVGSQNIEGCFKIFNFIFSLQPNLAKCSCGLSPLLLHDVLIANFTL
jgi:hypothetical protein